MPQVTLPGGSACPKDTGQCSSESHRKFFHRPGAGKRPKVLILSTLGWGWEQGYFTACNLKASKREETYLVIGYPAVTKYKQGTQKTGRDQPLQIFR